MTIGNRAKRPRDWRVAFVLLVGLACARAGAIEFRSPIGCHLGVDCFIQNYVDQDPSPKWQDFNCGRMTYDSHDGIDFRLRHFVDMQRGVAVRAAAAGIVARIRNDVPDQGLADPEAVRHRECGNGVMIDHEEGWQTQYCHLKHRSVVVVPGQTVAVGTVLGQVGFSGKTEFPHLHWTVRHRGLVMDPFTGQTIASTPCGMTQGNGLWQAGERPDYVATALLGSGFTTTRPDADGARRGKFSETVGSPSAPQLTVWVDIMGVQRGDVLHVVVLDPTGEEVLSIDDRFDEPKVLAFKYVGKRRPIQLWQTGTYRAALTLLRDGKAVFGQTHRLQIAPD